MPDWKVDNKDLLEQLSKLATSLQVVENEKYEMDLMELWEIWREVKSGIDENKEVIKTIIKEADNKLKPIKDDLDSDDDDLPAHDMSSKDKAPIHYLREVLDLLSDPESDRHEDCLSLIPKLNTPPLSMSSCSWCCVSMISRPTLSGSPLGSRPSPP